MAIVEFGKPELVGKDWKPQTTTTNAKDEPLPVFFDILKRIVEEENKNG